MLISFYKLGFAFIIFACGKYLDKYQRESSITKSIRIASRFGSFPDVKQLLGGVDRLVVLNIPPLESETVYSPCSSTR